MYRIILFPPYARFLYVKRARETLSLETPELGDLQMRQDNLSNACAHMEVDVAQHCFTPTETMKNQSSVASSKQKDITQNALVPCSSARYTVRDG